MGLNDIEMDNLLDESFNISEDIINNSTIEESEDDDYIDEENDKIDTILWCVPRTTDFDDEDIDDCDDDIYPYF